MSLTYGQRRAMAKRAHRAGGRYIAEGLAEVARCRAETDAVAAAAIARREQSDAAAPCDIASLSPGDLVRDRVGWHKVVRVSAKSVTVETGYSWTDRIAAAKIIETRKVAA